MRKRWPFGSFSNSSTVRIPAMPLPMTTRCSRGSAIMFMDWFPGCALLDSDEGEIGGFTPPAQSDRVDAAPGRQRQAGEDDKAEGVAAGELLGVAQAGGEIEAADAPGHAHQARHQADIAAKALRHQ